MATPEQKLAGFIAHFEPAALPPAAAERARHIIMAVLGTTLAGAAEDGVEALAAHLMAEGGAAQASVLVRGGKLPAAKAALLNATMARALDFCDAIPPGLHAGSSVVPAALAAAELRGTCSGAEFLAAVALGTEVATRMNLSEAMYDGFDPTGVAGVFGSTAAACWMLGLNLEQTLHALGLAFNRAGGSFQSNVDGALAVRMIQGWVAETGLHCAQLARIGLTGPQNFIQGVYGYIHLFGQDQLGVEQLVGELGERWAMLGTCFKRYPSCGLTQGVTELAMRAIEETGVTAEQVAQAEIRLPPYAVRLVGHPFTLGENPRVNAQFSAQYCLANVLLRRGSRLQHFVPTQVAAPQIAELVGRVQVQADEALDRRGHTAVDLELTLIDGRHYVWSLEAPRGMPHTPLTEEEHRQRFDDCLAYAGYAEFGGLADLLLQYLGDLSAVQDVRELIALMQRKAEP